MKFAIAFCAIQDSWIDGGHSFLILLSQNDHISYNPFHWQVENSFGFNPRPQGCSIRNYCGSITGFELPGYVVRDKSRMFGSPNIRCNFYNIMESRFRDIQLYLESSSLHPVRFSSAAPDIDLSSYSLPATSQLYSCVSFARKIVHYAIGERNLIPCAPSYFGVQTKNIPRTYWWHSLGYKVTFILDPTLRIYKNCIFERLPH